VTKKTTTAATTRTPTVKLTRHTKGWVAKIGGKVRWLAPLDKPELALQRYHQKRADFDSGRPQRPRSGDKLALADLADQFIERKFHDMKAGGIKPRTFNEYKIASQRLCDAMGPNRVVGDLRPLDFGAYRNALAARFRTDPSSLKRYITMTKAVFKWAERNQVIERPVSFGDSFDAPTPSVFRRVKAEQGERVFSAEEVRKLLKGMAGNHNLRAMFLLAINGGFGNTDVADLPLAALKLDEALIDFSRPKTGVARRCPLWPETIAALREALVHRPVPASEADKDLVFLTPKGHRYVRDHFNAEGDLTSTTDAVGMGFCKVAKAVGVEGTFYDGRRTFQTVGDVQGPEHVVRYIMGHAARGDDMGAVYRQRVDAAKMKAVTDHVRKFLKVRA
jgi:integrase